MKNKKMDTPMKPAFNLTRFNKGKDKETEQLGGLSGRSIVSDEIKTEKKSATK